MNKPRLLRTLEPVAKNIQSFQRATRFGTPCIKDDEWKYTRFDEVIDGDFEIPLRRDIVGIAIAPHNPEGFNLIFVNGFFVRELSCIGDLKVKELDSYALHGNDLFSALNASCFQDGISIHTLPDTILHQPINIMFIACPQQSKLVIQPRVEIILGENSKATVVENYICHNNTGVPYFTNASINITVGSRAELSHHKIQNESLCAFNISRTSIIHDKDSTSHSHLAMFGGQIARSEIDVFLPKSGSKTTLRGLYITKPSQHHNSLIKVSHNARHCTSNIKYKGVVHEHGTAAFDGLISVDMGAIKTDAQMMNKNLLLAESAEVNTRPRLEILADDIKCSHGATISQISGETLFYLRARGILKCDAVAMLTEAFIEEILAGMPFVR